MNNNLLKGAGYFQNKQNPLENFKVNLNYPCIAKILLIIYKTFWSKAKNKTPI